MNKKISIVIILVLVLSIVLIIKLSSNSSGSKELELTYKTNGGVPYKWEYEIEDESIVGFVKIKDITPEEDKELDGGPVYINYIFKGLKQGKTTITFKYVNIVDGSIEKEEKVTVKVDKNKNISLNVIP
jgi:predicted secreted protein